jgi:hypothetical protein
MGNSGKILKSKPVVTFGRCSALVARPAGGFCAEIMMYHQMDAIENRIERHVQSRLQILQMTISISPTEFWLNPTN